MTLRRVSRSAALGIRPSDIRGIRGADIKAVLSVGVPSAILTGIFDVANIVLNALMSAHGDLALAAAGIVMKAERLPDAFNLGICQAMIPIAAYNYSSGKRGRNRRFTGPAECRIGSGGHTPYPCPENRTQGWAGGNTAVPSFPCSCTETIMLTEWGMPS